jgi:methionyl-tRNA formyltransferase
MLIQILVDNLQSYIIPYAQALNQYFSELNYDSKLIHNSREVENGDILFLLSCRSIFKDLQLNKYNIVIHASDLPQGRGWSPMTWHILEGKNTITLSLFEAVDKVDAGVIYLKESVGFRGDELLPELQEILSQKIIEMAKKFVLNFDKIQGKEQTGTPTYYAKRTPIDSELDIHKTIDEQFNLLRVCDNEQYPAFFIKNGIKYILKIEKA